ncbi:WHSC1 [Acanthosepion pharaonis]|uniref:WHSC1 n=1 Tax=Acanthosepion pharaonis TaxID=158019 RepID=A0A812E6Y8_ACAPH|nr:WHSC1 [Sepia pharaonis]
MLRAIPQEESNRTLIFGQAVSQSNLNLLSRRPELRQAVCVKYAMVGGGRSTVNTTQPRTVDLMNGIGSTLVTQLPSIPPVCVNPKLTPTKIGSNCVLNEQVNSSILHFQSSLKSTSTLSSIEGDGKSAELASEKAEAKKVASISMDQSTRRRNRHAPKTGEELGDTSNDNSLNESKMKVPLKDPKTKVGTIPKDSSNAQKKTDPLLEKHEKPAKWLVGDLIWSKVSGHPWWPCLIACDPVEGVYTKVRVKGKGCVRNYHVQYFYDEPERAWVSENATLGFEGKDKFFKYVEDMLERAPAKQRSQISQKYGVSKHKRPVWDRAVRLAEAALPLSHVERKMRYITNINKQTENSKVEEKPLQQQQQQQQHQQQPGTEEQEKSGEIPKPAKVASKNQKQKTENNKVKSDSCPNDNVSVLNGTLAKKRNSSAGPMNDSVVNNSSPQRKKQKMSGGADQSSTSVAPKSGKDDGSFDMFCQKHREGVLSEHTDFDEQMVVEYLRQQWSMMSQKQKARYKSKFGGGGGGEGSVTSRATSSDEPVKEEPVKMEVKPTQKRGQSVKRTPRVSKPLVKKTDKGSSEGTSPPEVQVKRSPRVSKPSIKKLEAEEDNKLFTEYQKQQWTDNGISDNQTKEEEEERNVRQQRRGRAVPKEETLEGSYHLHCLGMTSSPPTSSFKCDQCTTGLHSCFCCKQTGNVKKCSVVHCGKFYHDTCVRKHPLTRAESKSFICPLHLCVTCSADTSSSKNPKAAKGRLCRCLRCPTAYHVGDFCIGAGSVNMAGNNIICSNHFVPPKNKKAATHINVSWCFICNLGGTLLCCDSCPAAFHADCINISCPEGTWYCQDCARGKKPLYGDIVWVKVGNYRWWPGEICHPKNVPMNIQQKPHQIGEFPVRFFGSHDYYWTNQARVFLFQEGDKGSKDSSATKGLAKIFQAGIAEATEAFKLWKTAKENRDQLENEKIGKKPAPFKFVKTNVPVGNVLIHKADLSEIPRCECRPDMENPCGSDSECLNRMLMYECHAQVCPAKEHCQNQRFTKRLYPDSVPAKTATRGWGLMTNVDIKKGQFVNEYVGDLIDEEECKKRILKAHEDNVSNFYMLTLDKNRIIDAGPKGNLSRFMNHSCQPNCETQKWMVNGDVRVGLFSLHDIPAGSELTFNYNLDCLGNEKKICACGAPNCSGFLGVRPKSVISQSDKKAKDMKKKKKRKRGKLDLKKHEDECFRCGEGGELVMCDKSQCPKVYHLQCLSLTKPPHGRWTCPWHHCDECGKQSVRLCHECPNSFCSQHSENNIYTVDGREVCSDHEDLLLGVVTSYANGPTKSEKAKFHSLCTLSITLSLSLSLIIYLKFKNFSGCVGWRIGG